MSEEATIPEQSGLAGLKAAHRALLERHAMTTGFKAGEVIFKTGDPANRFYCLLSGKVELWTRSPGAPAVKIDTIHAGELLGWSWLFPPYQWAFDAIAKTDTEAIFFYGTPLRELCDEDPAFGLELMKRMAEVMMRRLHASRQRVGDMLARMQAARRPVKEAAR